MKILQSFQYFQASTAYDICLSDDLSKGYLMTRDGVKVLFFYFFLFLKKDYYIEFKE